MTCGCRRWSAMGRCLAAMTLSETPRRNPPRPTVSEREMIVRCRSVRRLRINSRRPGAISYFRGPDSRYLRHQEGASNRTEYSYSSQLLSPKLQSDDVRVVREEVHFEVGDQLGSTGRQELSRSEEPLLLMSHSTRSNCLRRKLIHSSCSPAC